ncbi:NAD(P)-dependent glycerol-3-phosphate dehydrogenase [Mesoplasma syrphidae]|uniref:Glycerol-3-phosphate dehydrogenase [NAD(P)+] n=1 Tax=Mesoplasma syrphidae TaxID=225999 RepID=A0A2K9C9G1_9MOLU|nr:NAD(P)H-dependent glycerol-3-phosphate dehydrogenase [Mesoplasma syrphidae]AUF83665.1 NAD(P)-dependent glycerol-3-phosphate dehydrogenase [Mesoplasma syrphidae]
MNKNVTIIGTGAYGTALANVLSDNGHNVLMYGIEETQVNDININHENSFFFKNIKINSKIKATSDLAAALENTEILILGVPSFAIRGVLQDIKKYGKNEMVIVNTAKGLDDKELGLLSDVIKKEFAGTGLMKCYTALYGPSVAIEVIERKPTGLMLVSDDINAASENAKIFTNEYFFVYPWDDIAGCEIGAALKNTVAIAAGIFSGFKAGDNAQASLITLGLNEIYIIAKEFGAKVETFLNYAGLGDLILTASSVKSRNFRLGVAIVEQGDAKTALLNTQYTVEGVASAEIAYKICKKMKISSSLFEIIYEILYNNNRPISLINNVFKNVNLV